MITYLKHSVICIFNENKEEYNVKTAENDVKYSSFNMGEMDKSRELYSKEGDNSSRFEGKTVPWEHTIGNITVFRCVGERSQPRSQGQLDMCL